MSSFRRLFENLWPRPIFHLMIIYFAMYLSCIVLIRSPPPSHLWYVWRQKILVCFVMVIVCLFVWVSVYMCVCACVRMRGRAIKKSLRASDLKKILVYHSNPWEDLFLCLSTTYIPIYLTLYICIYHSLILSPLPPIKFIPEFWLCWFPAFAKFRKIVPPIHLGWMTLWGRG